jgi:hypothetical protein
MSRFRIVIQRIDDDDPERVTELDRIDVPAPELGALQKETALDQLETQTLASGHEVMRHLLVRQWERVDQLLVEQHQELFPPRAGETRRALSPEGRQPGGDPVSAPPTAPGRARRPSPSRQ